MVGTNSSPDAQADRWPAWLGQAVLVMVALIGLLCAFDASRRSVTREAECQAAIRTLADFNASYIADVKGGQAAYVARVRLLAARYPDIRALQQYLADLPGGND